MVDAEEISISEVNGYLGALESIAESLEEYDEFDWLYELGFEPLGDGFFYDTSHDELVETLVAIRTHAGRIKTLGGFVEPRSQLDKPSQTGPSDIDINLIQNANATSSASATASSSLEVELLISNLKDELDKSIPDQSKLVRIWDRASAMGADVGTKVVAELIKKITFGA